ncbi:hypothetical protein QTI27_37300, partial [Variovorax sp. J31P216]|nr:hypothetical protein [Variovorax sp. J31P216]
AQRTGLCIAASSSPVMHTRKRKKVQDLLTAVRMGKTVATARFALQANGQASLRGRAALMAHVPGQWMEETVRVASRCTFSLEELKDEDPREVVPEGETRRPPTCAGSPARALIAGTPKGCPTRSISRSSTSSRSLPSSNTRAAS